MTDYIVRATAADSQIRAFAATTREMTEYARKVHEESPVACAALGRHTSKDEVFENLIEGRWRLKILFCSKEKIIYTQERNKENERKTKKGLEAYRSNPIDSNIVFYSNSTDRNGKSKSIRENKVV